MTKDEALNLALEALEGADMIDCDMREAITAIKEALAQPEQEPVTLPENKKLILVDSSFDDLMYWLERCESKGHLENCSDLIEPWEKFCDSYCVWTDHHPDCKLAQQEPWPDEPVGHIAGGVHPPQRTWVGLTWEDANQIAIEHDVRPSTVKAIQDKLKEKNT